MTSRHYNRNEHLRKRRKTPAYIVVYISGNNNKNAMMMMMMMMLERTEVVTANANAIDRHNIFEYCKLFSFTLPFVRLYGTII